MGSWNWGSGGGGYWAHWPSPSVVLPPGLQQTQSALESPGPWGFLQKGGQGAPPNLLQGSS